MQRFEGLAIARQGLQVLTLVLIPLLFTGLLFALFAIFPVLLYGNDLVAIVFSLLLLTFGGYITLRIYFKAIQVPCSLELTGYSIVVNIEKRNIFYRSKQLVFDLSNIKNASCSLDVRLNKAFINITTRHPKTIYALQYLDDRADNPNPEIWQQIEKSLASYNSDARHQQISTVGFFDGTAVKVLMVIGAAILLLFGLLIVFNADFRTAANTFKFVSLLFIFSGLFASYYYNRKQNKGH